VKKGGIGGRDEVSRKGSSGRDLELSHQRDRKFVRGRKKGSVDKKGERKSAGLANEKGIRRRKQTRVWRPVHYDRGKKYSSFNTTEARENKDGGKGGGGIPHHVLLVNLPAQKGNSTQKESSVSTISTNAWIQKRRCRGGRKAKA